MHYTVRRNGIHIVIWSEYTAHTVLQRIYGLYQYQQQESDYIFISIFPVAYEQVNEKTFRLSG